MRDTARQNEWGGRERPLRLDPGELQLASERVRLAARVGRVGFWDFDLLQGTVEWDEQMFRLYGKNPRNAPQGAERWFSSIEARDIPYTRRILEECLSAGREGFEVEFHIIRDNDGEERVIHAVGLVERDTRGEPVRMVGVNWDVTDERRREAELQMELTHQKELLRKSRASEQAKGEFLAAMSHEVRTPMTAILGFAELLANDPGLPGNYRDTVRSIQASGESLLRVLDDVQEFTQLDSGSSALGEQPFSPRELLTELVGQMEPEAVDAGVEIQFSEEGRIPDMTLGDPARVRQALANLLGNAIKFSAGKTVSCKLRRRAGGAALLNTFEYVVADSGPGIPAEIVESLFLPVAHSANVSQPGRGGLGLGLAVSRHLARLMGGDVTLTRTSPAGSEFVFTLPVKNPRGAIARSPGLPGHFDAGFAERHPMTVLLVEDDPANLRLLDQLVRKLGYEPLKAADGRKAMAVCEEGVPDCIFMDLQMPEMDGLEATRRIREAREGRGPFIAALTANITPSDKAHCFEAGMNAFLQKPVKLSALAQVLVAAHAARLAVKG